MRRTPLDIFSNNAAEPDDSTALMKSARKPIPFLFDQAMNPLVVPFNGAEASNGINHVEHFSNGVGSWSHDPASNGIIDMQSGAPQLPMPPLKFARYYTQCVWNIFYQALRSFSFLPRG